MTYLIEINYKNKEQYSKLIKIPLNSEIEIIKEKDKYIIRLSNKIDTHLYNLKEDEIYGFSIKRIC